MVAEQTQSISRDWVKARQRRIRREAESDLHAQWRVQQVADALCRVGLPEPDSASIYTWGAYVNYLAQGDETKWRDLCHRARQIDTEHRVNTKFRQSAGTETQIAITSVTLPEAWGASSIGLEVSVMVGLRSTCHVEYEEKIVKVPVVVCND